MEVVILGGLGAIGSNIARFFKKLNYRVIVMDNVTRYGVHNNIATFRKMGIEYIHGDVRNVEDFMRIPKRKHNKQRVVVNCAAQPTAVDGYKYPRFDYTNNTDGVFNSLEYVRNCADGLIFFSTNKVYSADVVNAPLGEEQPTRRIFNPDYRGIGFDPDHGFSEELTLSGGEKCIYGATKAASDILVREYCDAFKIPHVVNRFSCMAGPWQWGKPEQGWVAWWVIAAELGLPIEYIGWGGKQVRDVLFTSDVCQLIKKEIFTMLNDTKSWGAYNVGGGSNHTLSLVEATALVEQMTGKKMIVTHTKEPRVADHVVYISDIRNVSKTFDWRPSRSVTMGYVEIYNWVISNIKILQEIYG